MTHDEKIAHVISSACHIHSGLVAEYYVLIEDLHVFSLVKKGGFGFFINGTKRTYELVR